jgi:dTDP-4-dehydrorhamnose reductase
MPFSSFELLDQAKPILVFGRDGQVGKALQTCLKDLKMSVIFLSRLECDLVNENAIRAVLNRYQPQVVINAAAYTEVDQAEIDRELAVAINCKAPKVMAQYIASMAHGILVHYSTDYVFADTKKTAYLETDPTGPVDLLSMYGQTKLAGERAIEEAFNFSNKLSHGTYQDNLSRYFILRTSWVYGDGGNFIRTILRLAGERDQLKVVADQVGAPSSAQWLAEMAVKMAGSRVESGIYHVVPDGEVSWHGLAEFAIEAAITAGEGLMLKSENIIPIPTKDYPTPAKRPHNSRLSNSKLKKALSAMAFAGEYPNWQDQVREYVNGHVKSSLKSSSDLN